MNQQDNYTYLIFDKAVENDHSYTNKITSSISIGDMFMSNHMCFEGISAIDEFNKFKEIENIEKSLDLNLYKPYLFSYSLHGAKVKIIIIAVNNKLLENYVMNKTQIPNKKFIISLCNSNILYEKVSSGVNLYSVNAQNEIENVVKSVVATVTIPNALLSDPVEEQPSYCSLPLWEYQKKTIKWMRHRELNPVEIYYNPNDELMIGNIVYDSGDQNFVSAFDRKKLAFCGGALIDEVGLGKTYQMMTVSLQNQASNINYIQRELPFLFSRATLVLCPNHLGAQWCGELIKLTKKNYGLNIIKLFTKLDYEKCTYQDILDADFIIVTFQFLDNKCFQDQFRPKISEMKSYFSSSKSTYTYLETQTVLDELGTNALNNPNILFQTFPNLLLIWWHRIVIDEFHEIFTIDKYSYMQRLISHFKGDNKWCMSGTPFNDTTRSLLSMFDFVTKYVNEIGDQIILNKNVNNHLTTSFFRKNTKQSINNEYTLPTPIENTIFLTFSTTEWMMYNAYLANPNIDKGGVLMRQLCCHPGIADEIKGTISNCKTLQDIETVMIKHYETQTLNSENKLNFAEYKLKMLRQKMKILTYKRQARFLRKNHNYKVKIEFGLESVNKDEMKKLEKYFSNDNEFLTFLLDNDEENAEDSEYDDDDIKKPLIIISDENQQKVQKILTKDKEYKDTPKIFFDLKDRENNVIQQIVNLKKDYDGKKSTSNYYNDVLTRLKKTTEIVDNENEEDDEEEKEQCGICLGDINGTDLGVTKCGHIFCYNCVKPFIHKKPSCPICSKPVKIDELYMITQSMPEEKTSKDFKDKQTLINAVGTKLANLIFFLKKNDKHCIIFSQWDDLLLKVGDVLNNYGIQNVFCKGNVWQCTKAVNDFNSNEKIKVIMLSSKSSASGMNLTKAEMVILLEPISGDYKDRRNTEWQAIGRAIRMGQSKQVQIVRFIIKNTIEDEIYKENLVENAKQVENIKIFELSEDATHLDEEKINEINKAAKESKPKKPTKKPTKKVVIKPEIDEDYGDY